MTGVDFVTLHIQSQSVQRDSEKKRNIQEVNKSEKARNHEKLCCIYQTSQE